MKQCPVCGSTFDDKVDFCFQDGTPLQEVADVDDPTALPTPSKGVPLAAAVTEIKPRRSRRGMFGRPSVADMLDVPSPGQVPPPGGVRVTEAPSSLESAATVIEEAPASDETAPREVEAKPAAISLEPKKKPLVCAVDFDADTILEEPEEAPVAPPPSLSVPVSALAVDVPEAQAAHEPTDAPPGLESDAPAALDDSWFGDETAFSEPEDTQPLPSDPIEDPGFAESSEPVGFDDEVGFADDELGFADDGLGYADDPSWGDVSSTQSQPIPKGMVFGGIGILAAAVVLTVVLSGGDEPSPSPAPPTPVAEAPAPAPPPAPAPVPEEDPVDDAMAMDGENGEGDAPIDAGSVEPALPVAVAKAAPKPAPAATPVKAAKTAKSTRTAQPKRAAKAAKAASRKSTPAPNVWTGAPAAAPAAPAAPAANPWGAPAETPSKGKLTITTEPAGAMVYVDDRRIGRSPTRTEVNFGTHKVRVELAEFKGNSRVVNVQAARVDVPFRLEAASLSGRCNLLGQAGASVVMDGKGVGSLPLTVTCSPGKHTFQVTPPGGGASFSTSRAVTFAAAGETANIFLNP